MPSILRLFAALMLLAVAAADRAHAQYRPWEVSSHPGAFERQAHRFQYRTEDAGRHRRDRFSQIHRTPGRFDSNRWAGPGRSHPGGSHWRGDQGRRWTGWSQQPRFGHWRGSRWR